MFIISAIIISLGFLYVTFQIFNLNSLSKITQEKNYLVPLNYINNLLEDSYNNRLINWMYLDCEYRVKVYVLNPTVEGFRVIKIFPTVKADQASILGIDCDKIKVVDQYGRNLFFKSIKENNDCGVLFTDFLNSYTGKYYYIYYNCQQPLPQKKDLEDVNTGNSKKYIYYIENIEFRDLFDRLFTQVVTDTLSKQTFSLISFFNNYTYSIEKFKNQSDWIYYQTIGTK